MRELFYELALRLPKVIIAALVGVLGYAIATGPGGAAPTVELWILCFIAGGIFVLLVQEGPI
jgi:hypothetical protein